MADHSENNLEENPAGLGVNFEEEYLFDFDSSDGQGDPHRDAYEALTFDTDEAEQQQQPTCAPLHVETNDVAPVEGDDAPPVSPFSFESFINDDTEQQQQPASAPLHVETNTAPVEGDDAPLVSAFSMSSSSSEEDEDADDEGDDHEADEQDANEYQFEDAGEQYEDAPRQSVRPLPAVLGFPDDDVLYKPNNLGRGVITYHLSDSSDSEGRKKKKDIIERRPSPLRTASDPDSPVSPKKASSGQEGEASQIGVLQPSPVKEDQYVVSPVEDSDRTPRPGSAQEQRSYAAGHDWSEDEDDEDDGSWLGAALNEVKHGSRVVDTVSSPAGNENLGDGGNHGDAVDEPEAGDEPTSPVSPLSPGNNIENKSLALVPLKRPFGFHLTTTETSPSDVADRIASSSDVPTRESTSTEEFNPTDDSADVHDPPSASGTFNPVFDGVSDQTEQESPTSPDPRGRELLTGMTPQEGINAWWKAQAERGQVKTVFRTNRNHQNQDRTGDLTPMSDSENKLGAADYLLQQRLKLKNEEGADEDVFDIPGDIESSKESLEATKEYIKLQMLKYRWQRNDYLSRGTAFMREAQEYQQEAQELSDRVGRRDRTIAGYHESLREANEAYARVCGDIEKLNKLSEAQQRDVERLEKEVKQSDEHVALYKRSAAMNAESMRQMRAARDVPLTSSGTQTDISQALEEDSSDELSVDDFETDMMDTSPNLFSGSRVPTPEHAINWPLEDRLHLVPFMTNWINEYRQEGYNKVDLHTARLDEILDAGFLSWDQLIKELHKLGYIFRPDHLAMELTKINTIRQHKLPRPCPAVMFAARRLDSGIAVLELLQEVASLEDQIQDRRDELGKAPNWRVKIENLENELDNRRVEESEKLDDLNHLMGLLQSRDDEISTLKNRRPVGAVDVSSAPDLTNVQKVIDNFIHSARPTETSDTETKLADCQRHGQQLQSQIDSLTEQLSESQEACATYDEEILTLTEKIASMEKQLADGPSAESDSTMVEELRAEIKKLKNELKKKEKQLEKRENLRMDLINCQNDGTELRNHIAQLEEELNEYYANGGQASSSLDMELYGRTAAAEQRARELQDKVDELEANHAPWRDTPESRSRAMKDMQMENDGLVRERQAAENEASLLKTENEELRKEIQALKEASEDQESKEDDKSKVRSEEGVASPQKESEEPKENCDEVRAKNKALKEELRKLKASYRELCDVRSQADQEQEEEYNAVLDDLEEQRQTNRDLREELRREREGRAGEQSDITKLREDLEEAQAANASLRAQVDKLKADVETLEDAKPDGDQRNLFEESGIVDEQDNSENEDVDWRSLFGESGSDDEQDNSKNEDDQKEGDDITELREDLREAQEANASLLAENEELKAKVEKLETDKIEDDIQKAFDQGDSDEGQDNSKNDDDQKEGDEAFDSREEELVEARDEIALLKSINKAQTIELKSLKEELSAQKPESQKTYSTNQGTQTDPEPDASDQSPAAQRTRSLIANATRRVRKSKRETKIRQSQRFIDGQEQRRLVREERQAAERSEVARIQARVAASFGVKELPYVPRESRYLPVAA